MKIWKHKLLIWMRSKVGETLRMIQSISIYQELTLTRKSNLLKKMYMEIWICLLKFWLIIATEITNFQLAPQQEITIKMKKHKTMKKPKMKKILKSKNTTITIKIIMNTMKIIMKTIITKILIDKSKITKVEKIIIMKNQKIK